MYLSVNIELVNTPQCCLYSESIVQAAPLTFFVSSIVDVWRTPLDDVLAILRYCTGRLVVFLRAVGWLGWVLGVCAFVRSLVCFVDRLFVWLVWSVVGCLSFVRRALVLSSVHCRCKG